MSAAGAVCAKAAPAFDAATAIAEVWIEPGEEETPLARAVRRALPHLEPRRMAGLPPPDAATDACAAGKRRLVLKRRRGSFLAHCPAGTPGLVCCNYLVMTLGSNCPLDCSYCFLQAYLQHNPALVVYTNPEDALAEVDAVLAAHPDRAFRVGTGELVDSLALDPLTETSTTLVPFFAARRNGVLELKTKTEAVDALLPFDGGGRVVVSWSVNPAEIIAAEEPGTAPLEARLAAARRVRAAGYKVGFHFDPLIEYPGWEEGYRSVVAALARAVDPGGVAWVSLGSLRLTPQLRQIIRARGRSRVLGSELVPSADGKLRVWRGLRVKMYRAIRGWLREWSDAFPVYLCMEAPSVWRAVCAETPNDRELAARLVAGAA